MFDYYTDYHICPKCGTPLNDFKLEYTEDNNIRCLNCFNIFKPVLNLDESDFSLINRKLAKEIGSEVPLFKNIDLNPIEESYIDWIKKGIYGNYLITWPWNSVKFIPELIFEFLSEFSEKKVVVISEMSPKNLKIYSSKADTLYDQLYYVEDAKDNVLFKGDLCKEDLFFKTPHVYASVKPYSRNFYSYKKLFKPNASILHDIQSDYPNYFLIKKFDDVHYRKFRDDFIENFKKLYGKDSIRRIRQENKTPETIGEFGIYDISIGQNNMYDPDIELTEEFKNGFKKAIKNLDVIQKCSDKFHSLTIFNNDEFNNYEIQDYSVFFINENIGTYYFKDTYEFINRVNPDLIIVENVDSYFGDIIQFNSGYYFKKLLKSNISMLMFSTNLNYRSIYRIGESKNYLNSNEITPHTWDYNDILTKLQPESEEIKCCGSSKFSEIYTNISTTDIEYMEVPELNEVESVFYLFKELLGNDESINKYLHEMIKTPLYIKGSPSDRKTFRCGNFTIESLLSKIAYKNEDICNNIIDVLDEVYNFRDLFFPKNPLFIKICDVIEELKDSNNLAIVVNEYDVKGVKFLLKDKFGEEFNIIISDWKNIDDEFDSDKEYVVISTLEPALSYNLHESNIKTLYFLGNSNNINEIQFNLRLRFEEYGIRPVYILSDKEEGPQLLKDTLNELTSIPELPKDFKREDLKPIFISKENNISSNEWDVNLSVDHADNSEDDDSTYNKYSSYIKEDSECLLVITGEGEGMFLPFNKTIYIQNDFGGIEEVLIDNKAKNHFVNKTIILDDYGFYSSFRLIFMNFIIKYGKNVPINYGNHYWSGFNKLINNAFEWLNLLRDCASLEMDKRGFSFNYASEILSEKLSKLGLNARNPDYINYFWFEDPLIINEGDEEFFIYEREHTRSVEDTIKIYQWIRDNYIDNLQVNDAVKCYEAAVALQRLRRGFLQREIQNLNDEHYEINEQFQEVVNEIMENAKKFRVSFAGQVRLSKDVIPFKIIGDYEDYI